MPNYEQSKKEKFYKLRKNYEDEIAREYPLRDDNLCDVYRRNLVLFLSTFNVELEKVEKISEVQTPSSK